MSEGTPGTRRPPLASHQCPARRGRTSRREPDMSYPYRIAVLAAVLGVALLATSCGSAKPDPGVEPTGAAVGSGPPPLPETSPPPLPTLVPITPAPGRR